MGLGPEAFKVEPDGFVSIEAAQIGEGMPLVEVAGASEEESHVVAATDPREGHMKLGVIEGASRGARGGQGDYYFA